jgi:hypothetical protein
MPYYIMSTSTKFSRAKARRIQKRIEQIDRQAYFAGPLAIPGNHTTGWLERPADGRNQDNDVSAANAKMAAIVREELGITE